LIAPAEAGGAESVVLAVAAAAPERTRVILLNQVAAATAGSHPLAELLRQQGVGVDEVRCGRRRYGAESRAITRLLLSANAALLHTHGYHATLVGWHAARRARLPVVGMVHGYLDRNLKERLYRALERWVLRRCDATITVSQRIRDARVTSGVNPRRIHVIQNGIAPREKIGDRGEARRLLALEPNESVIGWVGRLSREKGADLLLEAMSGESVPARVVTVGDGPERPALAAQARLLWTSAARASVHFAGQQQGAAGLIPAFDLLALTSRTEGTPMVILEAVAAGVPIVAFKVGGIPDLLGDDDAWLVRSGMSRRFGRHCARRWHRRSKRGGGPFMRVSAWRTA